VLEGRGQRHGERYLAGTGTRELRAVRPQGVIVIEEFTGLTASLGNGGVQLAFHLPTNCFRNANAIGDQCSYLDDDLEDSFALLKD